jgi:hypothetical protein
MQIRDTIDALQREWVEVRKAKVSFIVMAVAMLMAGVYGRGLWDQRRIDILEEAIERAVPAVALQANLNPQWLEWFRGAAVASAVLLISAVALRALGSSKRKKKRLAETMADLQLQNEVRRWKIDHGKLVDELEARKRLLVDREFELGELKTQFLQLHFETGGTQLYEFGKTINASEPIKVRLRLEDRRDKHIAETIRDRFNYCGNVIGASSPWAADIDPVYKDRNECPTTDGRIIVTCRPGIDEWRITKIFNSHFPIPEGRVALWQWRQDSSEGYDVIFTLYLHAATS